ncbi:MAG TPA: nucleotide exchange factor GrpE [Chloroflexota bacterium]
MTDQIDEYVTAGGEDYEMDPRSAEEAQISAEGAQAEPSVEELRRELEEARQQAAELQDKFLRAKADMENYKKRIERTYADLASSGKKELLKKLLGVMDNLQRALQYGDSPETAGEGILEGVRLTQYQLDQILQQEGVKPIEAEGKRFDPRLEEAIQSVNDLSVPDHSIVQVVRTGYTYGDEVLRPAQVVVSVHGEES